MREQTKKLRELAKEYKKLKNKLFAGNSFVVFNNDDPEFLRYNQLFMLFYPSYRTKEYKSPLTGRE